MEQWVSPRSVVIRFLSEAASSSVSAEEMIYIFRSVPSFWTGCWFVDTIDALPTDVGVSHDPEGEW